MFAINVLYIIYIIINVLNIFIKKFCSWYSNIFMGNYTYLNSISLYFFSRLYVYLHFDARRVIGIKPPHAIRTSSCVSTPGWSSCRSFPLSNCTTTTCSRYYSFAWRSARGSNWSRTSCSRLKKINKI